MNKLLIIYLINFTVFLFFILPEEKREMKDLVTISLKSTKDIIKVRKQLLNQIKIENDELTYSDIKVGILDTGVRNSLLEYRAIASETDYSGHGTHVAGIILALNPNVNLISKRYDYRSSNNQSSFQFSLKALISQNPRLINISAGGGGFRVQERDLIKNNPQILFVVSAGNDGHNILKKHEYYPAKYNLPNIISVANYNNNGNLYYSSNYGKNVHVGAYGVRIKSLSKDGGIKKMTGTSQAAPMITAMISKLIARVPNLSNSQIKQIIKDNCIAREEIKYGLFDFNKFNNWLATIQPITSDFLNIESFPRENILVLRI